jgi:ankyrin repeat protein
MVEILLELGANPNFINKRGDGLLALAVRKQNPDLVSKLLEFGADVTVRDSKGDNMRKLAKKLRSHKVLNLIASAYEEATSATSASSAEL